ncbi:hypothetical protein CQA49_00845 [Helicobacter sp. MIT 00-7814]|uniref:hypothetical protein n=1 Tax=unclassified Helicobacter TaxID=2593540 RepID=UPI000E1EF069|nr:MULTISPECIES: hypothetical protein [unclassified Helicobacter]RDU55060.1 hypothetical protein CQA37_04435 [Helicobacter sp. MIT 99-10781]RDU56879.1 hypothetical protein CQA49_00845 [Helicobacter sp. MIT 00-7814]
MQKQIILAVLLLLGLSACSSKKEVIIVNQQDYVSRYKPIIGSRNNDARTVIDFGVVAKLWVAPYKDQHGVLVAGHDIYVWLERPDFIPGSAVPSVPASGKSIPTQTSSLPFSLSPNEIDRSDLSNDANIQQYVNDTRSVPTEKIMDRIEAKNKADEEKAKKKK